EEKFETFEELSLEQKQEQEEDKEKLSNEDLAKLDERFYKRWKSEHSNTPLVIVSIMLAASLLFCGYQSAYIFRLANGEVGVFGYLHNNNEQYESLSQADDAEEEQETVATTISDAIDPWFSLEDAAGVTDPNRERLTTVEIVNQVSPATVTVYLYSDESGVNARSGSGSGFLITADGYIVTNAHVVTSLENQTGVKVAIPGYTDLFDAEIVGADVQTDIAVLKVTSEEDLPYVTLGDSSALQTGELVVAIGNPLGSFAGTVTVGVVSAVEREMSNDGYLVTLIQTDASINSGNSGGPLINSFGEVIGVTNAKMASAEGLGFAIPINSIESVIQSLINYGYVANRPYMGFTAVTITEESYFGAIPGVYVNDVVPDGPADQAGLFAGDVIISVDGVEINESSDIIEARDAHSAGDQIDIVIERDGEQMTFTMIIGDSANANG
nr:trypsin-like peptidase domain-containing protein [Saccharofermentans sp.]